MPGFVDEVSREGLRGWYVADRDQRRSWCSVVISINGEERYCALCQDARPDVVAAGVTQEAHVGFLAPLVLRIGDLVRVRALDTGRLLGGGLAVVMPEGGISQSAAWDGFLDVKKHADLPAFLDLIQPLRSRLDITAFRPLFGHRGNLSALCIETPAGQRVVHCQRSHPGALWLEDLYRRVLEPNGIAVPSLKAVIAHGQTASLVVEHIEGRALSTFADGNEQAYRDTIASAMRFQAVAWPPGMGGDRRGRRAFGKLIRSVCLNAFKQQRWQELGLLLRMLSVLYRLPRVFSHGDLHTQNVLIETHTGKPVFIDWDHAGKLPIGADLARLLLNVPPALAESWIGGSREERDFSASRECRLGWSIVSYFAHSQRQPDFHATEAGAYLRQRFFEASSVSSLNEKRLSQIP